MDRMVSKTVFGEVELVKNMTDNSKVELSISDFAIVE